MGKRKRGAHFSKRAQAQKKANATKLRKAAEAALQVPQRSLPKTSSLTSIFAGGGEGSRGARWCPCRCGCKGALALTSLTSLPCQKSSLTSILQVEVKEEQEKVALLTSPHCLAHLTADIISQVENGGDRGEEGNLEEVTLLCTVRATVHVGSLRMRRSLRM